MHPQEVMKKWCARSAAYLDVDLHSVARLGLLITLPTVTVAPVALRARQAVHVEALERDIAVHALASEEIRRLMTIPGISVTTAAAFMAAIGDIRRFPSPRHLVGYLGLDLRVR